MGFLAAVFNDWSFNDSLWSPYLDSDANLVSVGWQYGGRWGSFGIGVVLVKGFHLVIKPYTLMVNGVVWACDVEPLKIHPYFVINGWTWSCSFDLARQTTRPVGTTGRCKYYSRQPRCNSRENSFVLSLGLLWWFCIILSCLPRWAEWGDHTSYGVATL